MIDAHADEISQAAAALKAPGLSREEGLALVERIRGELCMAEAALPGAL